MKRRKEKMKIDKLFEVISALETLEALAASNEAENEQISNLERSESSTDLFLITKCNYFLMD